MVEQHHKNQFSAAKERMLKWDLKGRDITDPRVLKIMMEIPREEFVSDSYQAQAYSDGPLPIGMEQTISQPYIVALMTQELKVDRNLNILEIGTGSGYQTAVLSRLAKKVYTIERYPELSKAAQSILGKLGLSNIEFYVGDGSCGWPTSRLPESGYFDRIMLTAAVLQVPEPLTEQLVEGGLMIAPVGYEGAQELVVCQKKKGMLTERKICDVRFVKLLGRYGFEE